MKWMLCAGLSALVAIAAGCSRHDRIDPKKDYPDAGVGNVKDVEPGELVVWTEPLKVSGEGRDNSTIISQFPYDVFNERGRLLYDDVRVGVTLPPGRYLVRVEDSRRRPQKFWVTVESCQRTEVDAKAVREGKPVEPQVD